MSAQTQFSSHMELAQLPYFELRDGDHLVLADEQLGPAIDFHTHLALAYVRRMRVDLQRAHPVTQHYLPMYRALDLDIYQNRNFLPDDLSRMSRDLTLASVTGRGMRATHTIPNLKREMADLQIRASVLLAIDYPALSDNARTWLQATADHRELLVFGSVHPYTRHVERKLDRQKAMGARGIKVHPAVQLVRPDWPRCVEFYRMCARRQLPILFHCGPVGIEPRLGRYMSQVRFFARGIEQVPEATFVLGHSGALQMNEALQIACRHENVYLELASQSVSNIRQIIDTGPTDRVLFGSDWPFYHQASALAKVLIATEGRDPQVRRGVLHDNAARLLGLQP